MNLAILLLSVTAAIVAVVGIVRGPNPPWACIGVLLLAICNIIQTAGSLK